MSEYKGFTLASVHNCKVKLPDAYEFHVEHPGGILMCDHCKMKWRVEGTASPIPDVPIQNWNWNRWWAPYPGAAE